MASIKNEVDLAYIKHAATKRLQQLTRKRLSDAVRIDTYDPIIPEYPSDVHVKKELRRRRMPEAILFNIYHTSGNTSGQDHGESYNCS